MIKLVKIEEDAADRKTVVVYADTKSEVPETGAATIDLAGNLGAGSILYTADLDIAVLQGDDTWNWI